MSRYSTRQRKILLEYLQRHADETLSAGQIAGDLAGDGISLSAVYRNLSELEQEEKVRRLTKGGSRKAFFRYTDAESCRMHLHLSCSECGKTYHMDVPATNMLIRSVEEDASFTVDSANTVLYGVCKACRNR